MDQTLLGAMCEIMNSDCAANPAVESRGISILYMIVAQIKPLEALHGTVRRIDADPVEPHNTCI